MFVNPFKDVEGAERAESQNSTGYNDEYVVDEVSSDNPSQSC